MALSKGVYRKDDYGRLIIKDSNHKRRSKQNTYHVVNKNIASSKIPMVVRRKRGCHSGASPSIVGCSFWIIAWDVVASPSLGSSILPSSIVR